MRDTTITIQRPQGTAIATGIRVQADQLSLREVIDLNMAYGYQTGDYWKVYTHDWNYNSLMKRGDRLIDETYIDSETGAFMQYEVVGRPKAFLYDHEEVYARVVVGN